MAFGKVPRPQIMDEYITKPEDVGWSHRGPRRIVGVCVHRMDGTLASTYSHFSDPTVPALTDFGIGGALDGARDGEIVEYNSLTGERTPWASGWGEEGPDPEGNGVDFLNVWQPQGYDLNRDLASIEVSGLYNGGADTRVTAKQLESLCQLMAYIFDHHCKVSWRHFPHNPRVGAGFFAVYEHYEFSAKPCPFAKLRALKGEYLARTRGILKWYQTGRQGTVPPDYIEPVDGYPIDDDTGPPPDPEPDYRVDDWIRNAKPHDINLRAGPSTSSGIVTTLVSGKLLCVTGAPIANEGFRWYPVRVTNGGQVGYVAGELCSLKQRNGCGTGPAPGKFEVGDRIVARTDLNVRSSPGTGGGTTPTPGMETSDPLQRAVSRGVANNAIEYGRLRGAHRSSELKAYAAEVYRTCALADLDAAILIAQSSLETGAWTSVAWRDRLNPAGIGITGPDVEGETFANGVAAARAQVAHMHAYVYGNSRSLPSDLVGADPRYQAVFDSGYDGTVVTIADLAGKWAVDPDYATKIVQHGNAIYGTAIQAPASSPAPESVIDVVTAGTELCVKVGPTIADGYEWYDVEYTGRRGWVAAEYCDLKRAGGCGGGTGADFGTGDQIHVFDGPLNYRSEPGLSGTILGSVPQGALLCVTGGPQTADGYTWYRVTEGWVAGEFCELNDRGGCTGAGAFAVND